MYLTQDSDSLTHWTHKSGQLLYGLSLQYTIMSQSIPTGYIPPGNPRGLAQKTCPGGGDLTFESCPGAGNSTRTGILWKMKVKLQKNSVDQIFTGENKKQAEFLTFSRFTCFLNGIFPFYGSIFWFCYHTYRTKNQELPLACLYLKFSLGYGYPHLLLYKRL